MINENGGNMPDAVGVPEDQLRQASKMAVCKINIDSDLRLAMTGTIRKFFNEHPEKFDPRGYLGEARKMIEDSNDQKGNMVSQIFHKAYIIPTQPECIIKTVRKHVISFPPE